jgi:hypothetical protein
MKPAEQAGGYAPASDLRFTVGRLTCRFRLPDGLPDPAGVSDRLARLAEDELSTWLQAHLDSLAGDDQAVYRIRRVSLDLWVDVQAMSTAEIGRRWGQALAGAASRAIQEPDSTQVVRFETPRHYLTAFLRDLLDGRAWSRWYYAEFLTLQRLSAPEIAVLLLARYPDWIAPILLDLEASGHAARLIHGFSQSQVERLWKALGFPAGPDMAGNPADLDWLAGTWRGMVLSGAGDAAGRARNRLRGWLHLARADLERARQPHLAGWLLALVDLDALLRARPDLAPSLLMESGLFPAALRDLAGGPFADQAGWLAAFSQSGAGRRLLSRLAQAAGREDTSARHQAALSSPVGSVFLLLPALVESGLWETWAASDGEQAARGYIYLLALKALGRSAALSHASDPMLAAFAGLGGPPAAGPPDALEPDQGEIAWGRAIAHLARQWLAAPVPQAAEALQAQAEHFSLEQSPGFTWLTPALDAALSAAASVLLRRLAGSLTGMGNASPSYLARQFLAQPADLQRDPGGWRLHLSGGPLKVILQLSALPERVDAPWLPAPVGFHRV